MSNAKSDDVFWDLVDEFISRANEHAQDHDMGIVAAALMQSAARFSSFYVAASSESRNDLKDDKDSLVSDVSRDFKKQFAQSLEDYIENYKVYLGLDKNAD